MIVGWFISLHSWLFSAPAGPWLGRYRQLVLRPHARGVQHALHLVGQLRPLGLEILNRFIKPFAIMGLLLRSRVVGLIG